MGLEEQLTYVDLAIRAMAARLQGVPDAQGMLPSVWAAPRPR